MDLGPRDHRTTIPAARAGAAADNLFDCTADFDLLG
jgi:hypothetical protein